MWPIQYLIAIAPRSILPGLVAPERILSMGQIEIFDNLNWVQTNDLC